MTLVRFDPFRELDRWSRQARPTLGYARAPRMPFDAVRREHELVLQFDLPGVDPDTIDVTVDKDTLTVAAERTNVRQDGDEVVIAERPSGRFVRQLRLSEGLDAGRGARRLRLGRTDGRGPGRRGRPTPQGPGRQRSRERPDWRFRQHWLCRVERSLSLPAHSGGDATSSVQGAPRGPLVRAGTRLCSSPRRYHDPPCHLVLRKLAATPVWRSWKRRRLVIVRSWVRVPPPALLSGPRDRARCRGTDRGRRPPRACRRRSARSCWRSRGSRSRGRHPR